MLYLYFKAPFGAFRPFKSVELSPTAPFVTHSAAYGFLLGLAGIDRLGKKDYMDARIAIGCSRLPKLGRSFQQLIQGQRKLEQDIGGDFKLRPFWREVLINLEGYICLDHPSLEVLVEKGVKNPSSLDYWGLPFMGDNNFFVERIDVVDAPQQCRWFCPFEDNLSSQGERLHYLSVWTDYEDSAKSKGLLFALKDGEMKEGKHQPPDKAWVSITGN